MTLGDRVRWVSQAGGHATEKRGIIVAVVPAGVVPKDYDPRAVGATVLYRDHESYLVRVGRRRRLYWPSVSHLRRDA